MFINPRWRQTQSRGLNTLTEFVFSVDISFQKVIDFLKMDIEGSEWEALEAALDEEVLINHVKQLAVEFHSVRSDNKYLRYS